MKNIVTLIIGLIISLTSLSQSSCGSPLSIGTPTSTETCQTISTAGSGSSPCAGSGYGGPGGFVYINFCTNSNGDCINFSFGNLTTAGNWAVTIYDASCVYTGNGECMGTTGTGASFNTANYGLSPNTCYTARVWVKTSGSFEMCVQSMDPPIDECSGALPISSTPQSSNNICTTPGPTTNTPTIVPSDLCAGSLENTAWYSFTTLNTGDVVVTIDNIVCSGGASGFQIGYFVGSCGSLNNIGCQSGSGGSVTATITGLNAGDEVYIAIDGNAGANCTYDISATNTTPLPIELAFFVGENIEDNINHLHWVSFSELNNDYYELEVSNNGYDWSYLVRLDGMGTTSDISEYRYNHYNPKKDLNYYRLKQVDYNGESETFNVIVINNKIIEDEIMSIVNVMGQKIDKNTKGIQIRLYNSGKIEKVLVD